MKARWLLIFLLVLDLALLWIFRMFIGSILWMPVFLGWPVAIWRRPRTIRLIKLLLAPILLLCVIIPKPWTWPREMMRRIDRHRIINSDDESIEKLQNELMRFIDEKGERSVWEAGSEEERLKVVDRFIDRRVPYSYDFPNWGVFCHTADPFEVLFLKCRDDCQGRACVTVSLLKRLGVQAYCAETPFHWYTAVLSQDGRHWNFLNRGSATDPLFIFDDHVSIYPWSKKPAPLSMSHIIDELWVPRHNKVVFGPFRSFLCSPVRWSLFLIALGPISCLLFLTLHYPEDKGRIQRMAVRGIVWIWFWLAGAGVAAAVLVGMERGVKGCLVVVLACLWIAAAGARPREDQTLATTLQR